MLFDSDTLLHEILSLRCLRSSPPAFINNRRLQGSRLRTIEMETGLLFESGPHLSLSNSWSRESVRTGSRLTLTFLEVLIVQPTRA